MNFQKLNLEFQKIKKLGWIETKRKGSTGIGLTLELLLGKKEDRESLPDYNGIEIKTKKYGSHSYTTLFSLTPKSKKTEYEIKRLVTKFGYPDKQLREFRVLNVEMYANKKNLIANRYYFQLEINREEKKIYLKVTNWNDTLNEKEAYWTFSEIEERLNAKLRRLAVIHALKKKSMGKEYYKYYRIDFYVLKNFDIFLELLELGIIQVKLKIGVIRSGEKKGRIHDHGTSFDINELDLDKLFHKINI